MVDNNDYMGILYTTNQQDEGRILARISMYGGVLDVFSDEYYVNDYIAYYFFSEDFDKSKDIRGHAI